MTFAEEIKRFGRRPITLVHLTVPRCSLTYGIAPCTAAIGVTGDKKCYNAFATCQDTVNYTPENFTFKFCSGVDQAPQGYRPCVMGVNIAGQEISIGEKLGIRGNATISMQDFKDSDVGIDKYIVDRGFDPKEQGSFWPKFKRRWKFYQNQTFTIKILTGYIEEDGTFLLSNFQTRNYILDAINGPDSRGKVNLVCKDKLKLADDKRALVPSPSSGTLLADISAAATSFTMSPSGVGNSEYPASGTVSIGDEAMTFTRSGDVMTVVRGADGTEAKSHKEGAVVQLAAVYSNATVSDVAHDLLTTYGNVPGSLIVKADWDAESADWLSGYRITRKLYKPTGVTQRLNELIEQCLFYLIYDEVADTITFTAIRPPRFDDVITQLDDEKNHLSGTLRAKDLTDRRISRYLVYFGIINPVTDEKEPENYSKLSIVIDPFAESADEYGDVRQKIVFAHWLDDTQLGSTLALGGRNLSRFRDIPRQLTVVLDFKDDGLDLGSIVDVDTHLLQDDEGLNENLRMQAVKRENLEDGSTFRLTLEEFTFVGRFAFIGPNSLPDFSAASEDEINRYGWISDNSPAMLDGTEAYRII